MLVPQQHTAYSSPVHCSSTPRPTQHLGTQGASALYSALYSALCSALCVRPLQGRDPPGPRPAQPCRGSPPAAPLTKNSSPSFEHPHRGALSMADRVRLTSNSFAFTCARACAYVWKHMRGAEARGSGGIHSGGCAAAPHTVIPTLCAQAYNAATKEHGRAIHGAWPRIKSTGHALQQQPHVVGLIPPQHTTTTTHLGDPKALEACCVLGHVRLRTAHTM